MDKSPFQLYLKHHKDEIMKAQPLEQAKPESPVRVLSSDIGSEMMDVPYVNCAQKSLTSGDGAKDTCCASTSRFRPQESIRQKTVVHISKVQKERESLKEEEPTLQEEQTLQSMNAQQINRI